MEHKNLTSPPEPITTRAAHNGLYVSLYLSVLVLSMGFSLSFPPAALLIWIGTLGLPFFLYRILSRSNRVAGALSFAELWAEGIASFILGTLIPELVAYVGLLIIMPDFMAETVRSAIAILSEQGTPEAQNFADTLSAFLKPGALPSPADVAAQLISFNIIAGTGLSLVVALFVKLLAKVVRK